MNHDRASEALSDAGSILEGVVEASCTPILFSFDRLVERIYVWSLVWRLSGHRLERSFSVISLPKSIDGLQVLI